MLPNQVIALKSDEGLGRRTIITISPLTYRHLEPMLVENLLIILKKVLAAPRFSSS